MNLKGFIIALLRRGSYRWPIRTQAMKLARVSRGQYKCNHCKGTFNRKDIQVDHVNPVVDPIEGFTDWNDYIKRMFPENVECFQILCKECHNIKTLIEKEIRKKNKKTVDIKEE